MLGNRTRRRLTTAVAGAAAVGALLAPVRAVGAPVPATPPAPAEPTLGPLISGATSLVGGTHVWTDYAYDDRGPASSSQPVETGNAYDLIQLQLRVAPEALHVRAVLETLVDPRAPLLGVGLDLDARPSTGARTVPGGGWDVAGAGLGLERMVVVGAGGARVLAWRGDRWQPVATAPASVDPAANTIDASIPRSLLGVPMAGRWRAVGVVGAARQSWVDGAGPIVDLAYVRDASGDTWESGTQGAVLTGAHDAAAAIATVDVDALRAKATRLARPTPGVKHTFLYRSALRLGEGIGATEDRKYAGPYQPYAAWTPAAGLPPRPPLVVFLHGAMNNHRSGSYGGDGAFVSLGPVGVGPGLIAPKAVVVTPLGRGETALGYPGASEQDLLDVVGDASTRFGVDQDRVVVTGYSLGGVGTFNLAQHYPDRWAGAVEIVGAHDLGALTIAEELGGTQTMPNALENLRNLPFRLAHARLDELEILIGAVQPDLAALELHRLGYDYRYWQFQRREHVSFPVDTIQCELEAAIARGRVRDPARITYSQSPAVTTRDARTGLDLRHDRAYWMRDLVARGSSFAPGDEATVDVTSLARARRTTAAEPVVGVHENVTAGRDVCGPNDSVRTNDVWTEVGQRVTAGPPQPVRNALEVTLTGVASVGFELPRAGIDVARPVRLDVTTDGPSRIRLHGPWPGRAHIDVTVPAGTRTLTVG